MPSATITSKGQLPLPKAIRIFARWRGRSH